MNLVVNGLLAQYHESGPGQAPVVLLLHGWGVDSRNLDGVAGALSADFRVISPNLPGFGGSEAPPKPWNVADYAQFVHDFLSKLGIKELAAVLGHSFGGRIAIKGLAHDLIPAQRVVLLDSAGVRPNLTTRRSLYKIVAKTGKAVLSLPGLSGLAPGMRRRLYQSAGSTDYLSAGNLRQTFINVTMEDLQADASKIPVPAALIWGGDDTDTPPEDGRKLANAIPHASLHIIDGAGHFAHIDAPDRVCAAILDFLK